MPAFLVGALVFMVAVVIFIMQNNTPVAVHFISWHTSSTSLALIVLIAAMGGAIITFLTDSFRAFKTGRKLRELINYNKKLEREVASLKANSVPPEEKP